MVIDEMSSSSPTKKVALVTGANRGIGLAIAKSLSSKTHGFHVILGSRNIKTGLAVTSSLKSQGYSVEPIALDLSNDTSIQEAIAFVTSKFGKLDILINNAGISSDNDDALSLRDRFETTYNVNVFGAAIITEAFVPLLSNSPAPRVVFVSSNLGSLALKANLDSGMSGIPVPIYRSSKAAMNMLMSHYAGLYKAKGWKINACHPGFTSTGLTGGRGGSVEDATRNAVRLATLGKDGETGTFSEWEGALPW
jgi:NAD(P)-dependent dehydrogenase (short-subunit alcohol dehydrogenase family)